MACNLLRIRKQLTSTMRQICTILFLILVLLERIASAQIYCYVWGDFSEGQRSAFMDQIQKSANFFDMEDVTFAIIKCELPRGVNATTEYEYNEIVQRKMILFRISNHPGTYKEVLAHEMIHGYQFYSSQLIRHDRFTYTWKGKKYEKIHKMDHCKRPWEIEAIAQSKQLVSAIDHKGNNSFVQNISLSRSNPN